MKIVYIAGPYKGPTGYERFRNIDKAEDAAIVLWNAGFGVFCPHKNSEGFDLLTDAPEENFLKFDLHILDSCDIVCLLPGWRQSKGARAEKKRAEEMGKHIYEGVDAVIEAEA